VIWSRITAVDMSSRVTVTQAAPGLVRVEVRDDGPGIPAADRERVFERSPASTSPRPQPRRSAYVDTSPAWLWTVGFVRGVAMVNAIGPTVAAVVAVLRVDRMGAGSAVSNSVR
jgi:hypothetical protein